MIVVAVVEFGNSFVTAVIVAVVVVERRSEVCLTKVIGLNLVLLVMN